LIHIYKIQKHSFLKLPSTFGLQPQRVSWSDNRCNSYVVPEKRNEGDKTNTIPEKKTMLWHQRLGHIGEKGLQTLHSKGMVEGMSNFTLDFDFCENCIYGKHNRVRFSSSATRVERILELVHK
jgi:hypothetical protein